MNRMNGKNQYRCHFCEKMCKPLNQKCPEYSKHTRMHYCTFCDVHFAVGPKCRVHGAHFAAMDPKTEKNIYSLKINYKDNKTQIDYLEWTDQPDTTVISGWWPVVPGTTYTIASASGQTWTWTVPPKHRHIVKPIMTLDKALKDINPNNVYEKIKMYILFS